MKRRSEAGLPSTGDEFNLKLFEHALKDPITKNAVLKLLTSQNKSVFELFNNNSLNNVTKSPVRKLKKRDHCESPTALLRRRELEKINRPESAQSNSSEQSSSSKNSALNFENILNGVKVYVEINSNGNDRSAGAKALLRSMGAIVRDQFTRDVTHVIFKDGSYQTYQRAKLLKVHFVSVLWLEASRRNGVRVPEKDYPALGTKNYDKNISLICSQIQKDYEDVIREEVRHSLQSGFPLPSTKSLLENRRKTIASTSKLFDTSTNSINSGPCEEMESILSKFREQSQQSEASSKIYSVHNVDEDLLNLSKTIEDRLNSNSTNSFESSNSILGRKNSNILVSDSDCSMANRCLSRSSGKSVILEDSFDAVTPVEPLDVMSSNMEITCSNDSDNSDSMSLISRRQTPKRKSKNITTNMDLTNLNAETSCQRNDISEGNTGSILNSIKGSILNSISYFTKTPILDERNSKKQKLDNKENCNLLTSDDDVNEADLIYNCKTPKLKNIKEKQIPSEKYLGRKLIINSEEQVGNVAKSSTTPLRTSTSSEKARIPSENEKNSPNVSSSRIPDSTEGVRNSKGNKTISTDAPSSRMSNNSNKERTTTGNKTGSKGSLRLSDKDRNSKENEIISVAMSPLQISNKSNEEGNSKENKTNSIDMSSLRISDKGETSRENKTGSTDMSSKNIRK
ncbi:hypothetical protein HHI36_018620 [Cryptolaemus montrouzieri]|uniref:BRCT domain-containing protein n=1 Tax=Cryptolaemus montrouzieri TaxID=559131 RepID=A0ABD2P0P3_9CUCU